MYGLSKMVFDGNYLYLMGAVDFKLSEPAFSNDTVQNSLVTNAQGIRSGLARIDLTSGNYEIDPELPDLGLSYAINSSNSWTYYSTIKDFYIINNKLWVFGNTLNQFWANTSDSKDAYLLLVVCSFLI
jgi:hypothetical protein